MNRDQHDEYLERLLQAQYDASEFVEHKLTRGEIREDFIRSIIEKEYRSLSCVKGFLCTNNDQLGQCDLAILPLNVRLRSNGNQIQIDPAETKLVCDVKSTITTRDIKKANDLGKKMQMLYSDNSPLVGLFGYRIKNQLKSFVGDFGYTLQRLDSNDTGTYSLTLDYTPRYPYIDFIISIHNTNIQLEENINQPDTRKFYIIRDRNNNKFNLFLNEPITKNFFDLISSIARTQ